MGLPSFSKKKVLIIIIVALVVAGVAAFLFFGGSEPAEEEEVAVSTRVTIQALSPCSAPRDYHGKRRGCCHGASGNETVRCSGAYA